MLVAIVPRTGLTKSHDCLVAVAANFAEVAQALIQLSPQSTDRVRLSVGATGQLFARIMHGAPYDIFLSADQSRPRRLEQEGAAVSGTRFTYALGQLTLWSASPTQILIAGDVVLGAADFRRLAIANPKLAPYGLAARQVLMKLGVWDQLSSRLVLGANVSQVRAMIMSGNAELGFVARSSVLSPRVTALGSHWDVPTHLHAPIRQDAVLTRHGKDNAAAKRFLTFLRSASARALITRYGYGVE